MVLEVLGTFLLSIILIWLIKLYAPQIGLIDIPNKRSTHSSITPRGAGIGFVLSALLLLPIFHMDIVQEYGWTFAGIVLVFIVGILDDHRDISPRTKFIIIILSTIFLSFDNIIINGLGIFFGISITLGWFALPFTIFAVSGFTNALNLIDGLDGLSATLSIVILGAFAIVGYQNHDIFIFTLSSLFIAALIAFLIFNWHPASIFMGDSGSLTLGFVISVIAIKSLSYLPTISILFLAAIPILDTLIVMIRRKCNGKSIFTPDHCHVHHIFRYFFSENTPRTVLSLVAIQLIYSLIGLQLNRNNDEGVWLFLFILNVIFLYLFLNTMIKRQKREC